ncbi:MAG TPA: intradiol ring-cleavage dioxygenase [Burkholderiaceae bacterium]|nr:intradiol ring-cleavage dioxygenase [Burkholderiaceae bacterium]
MPIRLANLHATPLDRRRALLTLGALGLLGCGAGAPDATSTSSSDDGGSSSGGTAGSCALMPQETEGPYPLLAILSNNTMVRQDITEGKAGVALKLVLKLVDVNNACAPIANTAVYVWHCDKDGLYSGYSQPAANTIGQTFCRGIQITDGNGEAAFETIYPGWYAGRITHIHFQAYLSDNLAVSATATSQIAFPQDVTSAVYDSSLYVARGQNTSVAGFSADSVFADGTTYQMATLTGDVTSGYTATLTVGIAA